MFEDIIPTPQHKPNKREIEKLNLNRKLKKTETPKIEDKRLYPQSSLSEQVMKLDDLKQLIQILEIAKKKVKRKKIKQRKDRVKNRNTKW